MRKAILIVTLLSLAVPSAGLWLLAAGSHSPAAAPVMRSASPGAIGDTLSNPFIGLAPAASGGPYRQPHRLVYLNLTWRDLEPVKGRYAFEAVEARYKFAEWDRQQVKLIIRPVLDYASDTRHMDIPDWVYEAIGGDGVWYDEEVGKGFSPNYDNKTLIALHREMIRKLGERYNRDPRVAFIALGSLGHWGEWHTYSDEGMAIPFPKLAVSDQYVKHYLAAFSDKKLLMRRPHPIAGENGIGLYNDMFGVDRSTADFIDWFENGYLSSLAGGVRIPPMKAFWKRAPSGGEFGNADQAREYVRDDRIGSVLAMARRSHLSWIGATLHADMELNAEEQANLDKLVKLMGYRFRVKQATLPAAVLPGSQAAVTLEIANEGVAPFYYDWPVELSLTDAGGKLVARTVQRGVVTGWMPGDTKTKLSLAIPRDAREGVHRLRLAILDPADMRPGVELAMEGRQPDGRYELAELEVRRLPRIMKLREWLGGYVTP